MKKNILIVSILLLISLMGCRERVEPQVDDFVEYGWVLYAERDFRGALAEFEEGLTLDSVYADGYNGLGWCYSEFNEVDSAIHFFDRGLQLTQDTSNVQHEMSAGLALSYHANQQYTEAFNKANAVHTARPFFEFTHDWRINYVDIIVVAAASKYALGEFGAAYTWVRKYDNTFVTDVSTLEGRAKLIKKIEAIQNL